MKKVKVLYACLMVLFLIKTLDGIPLKAYANETNENPILDSSVTDDDSQLIPLDTIMINQNKLIKNPGELETLTVNYYPYNTTDDKLISWTSSNSKIATIDSSGKLTAVGTGQTTITARVGVKSASCIVIVNPVAPKTIKAVSNSYNSILVSWDQVSGASGYKVYRATSKSGNYTLLADVKTNTFLNKSLKNDLTYYYKVCATSYVGGSEIKGLYTSVASASPKITVPLNIKATVSSKNSIKITWDVVKGAVGYRVYRATSYGGSYSYIKSVTTNYYDDKYLTTDRTYYYKIKAFNYKSTVKDYSGYSMIVCAKPIDYPKSKGVTLGMTEAQVYKLLGKPMGKEYYASTGMYNFYYKKNRLDSRVKTTTLILKYKDNAYRVVGWYNKQDWINISDGYDTNSGTFTLGSTMVEVAKAMETPISVEVYYAISPSFGTYIRYRDGSTVSFDSKLKVKGWNNKGCLKAKFGAIRPTGTILTLGSTLNDISIALGTPTSIGSSEITGKVSGLTYQGTSMIIDKDGKLVSWLGNEKKLISIGEKDANFKGVKIKIGTSFDTIIKKLGSPDSYELSPLRISYGKTTYFFDIYRKVSSINVYN
jgi:outer membrane protein assembly factor BamE (lipoprotein component of BamABCDE complex)